MTDEPLYYHGSKESQLVEEMHLAHLKNAVAKIERMGERDVNFPNLEKIRAVYERRQAEWDAANPPADA